MLRKNCSLKQQSLPKSEQQARIEKRQLAKRTQEITHVKWDKNVKPLPSKAATNLLQELFFPSRMTQKDVKTVKHTHTHRGTHEGTQSKTQIVQCKFPRVMIHPPSRGSVTPEQTDAVQMKKITTNGRENIFNSAKPTTLLTVYASKIPSFPFAFVLFCALHSLGKQTRDVA